jgi:excisionase family DNA binding protein
MVQYYTLEEAAKVLQVSPDKLRDMVKRNEVRAFQDRGTLRFRAPEVDELARQLGVGSDPDLKLGETPAQPPPGTSSSARRRTQQAGSASPPPGGPKSPPPSGGPKSPPPGGPASAKGKSIPPQRPSKLGGAAPRAADSDVRLVADGSDLDFHIDLDAEGGAASPPPGPGGSGARTRSGPDSGVRIVPLEESDSDVKIEQPAATDDAIPQARGPKTASDSDIRLEGGPKAGGSGKGKGRDALITEEIDLDAEEAAQAAQQKKARPTVRPGSSGQQPALPTSSPFEISENDINMEDKPAAKEAKTGPGVEDSSDIELTPAGTSPILEDDDEVELGALTGEGGKSGINLQPGDSGISLEQGGSDELELELSLEESSTPKPARGGKDSSSEFELSLDEEDAGVEEAASSSSEFELTLDDEDASAPAAAAVAGEDSDSEFELTLDEEGGLAPVEEPSAMEEDKDIFVETDFDVPALDDESGSEAVPLEDLEEDKDSGAEFEVSQDEEVATLDDDTDSDSGSDQHEVMLEDEEPADEAAETVARRLPARSSRRQAAVAEEEEEAEEPAAEEEEGLDLDLSGEEEAAEEEEVEEEEDEPARPARRPQPVAAAPEWGPWPAVLLLPTVIVLFLVGLMGFEMVQGMWGYKKPSKVGSLVLRPLASQFEELPKE